MSSDQTEWKDKINGLLNTCQNELKKTTRIGKKMLSATHTNTKLHDTYESIGRLVKKEIDAGSLNYPNEKLDKLVEKINLLESQLESFENEVQNIKKK